MAKNLKSLVRKPLFFAGLLGCLLVVILSASTGFAQSGPQLAISTGGTFSVGQTWTLNLAGAATNQPVTLCAIGPGGPPESCWLASDITACATTPNTTASGTWSCSGTFPVSAYGDWEEWVQVGGIDSNRISFLVGATATLTINGTAGGAYAVGGPWTLAITSNLPNSDVCICAIVNNGAQTCTPGPMLPSVGPGATNGNGGWSDAGTFSTAEVGQWNEWARVYTSAVGLACPGSGFVESTHVNFTVATCQPETDPQFCQRLGKNCGQVSAPDNCGTARVVSDCSFGAGCTGTGQTCGDGGNPNVCGSANSSLTFTITAPSFCVGRTWAMQIASTMPNQNVDICAIHPNGAQDCTPAGPPRLPNLSLPSTTNASGNWTGAGTFSAAEVGSWTEWVRIGSVESRRVSFSVAATCCAANAGSVCNTNTNCGGSLACDGFTCINGVDCTQIAGETCGGAGISNECGKLIQPPPAADTNIYDLTRYNPLPSLSFSRLLCTFANWIVSIGLVLVVIMIAIAGILILSSRDNEQQRTKGKQALEGAVVGLIVLLLAKGIILVILGFLGIALTSMTC